MPAYDNEGATISMEDVRDPDGPITISTIEEELIARRNRMFKQQKSTIASRKEQAVCVRRAHKRYGPAKNPNIILDGLNMTVPKGAIYGLLGASGCGKTTLLSCIVGRRRLNSGEIWVLGGKPGSPGSGVPGPRIGYMPQEVALFGEFSIRETLIYFGWIANMNTKEVEERIDFLIALLQLPNPTRVETLGPWGTRAHLLFQKLSERLIDATRDQNSGVYLGQRISIAIQQGNAAGMLGTLPSGSWSTWITYRPSVVYRQVKNLSGGQQRRTSLAAALIHDPELLILDEPTVGVDPVLRQSIWDHLVEITKGGRTTVIITTHYIDETKQANIIGLMRGGRFLAEESPQTLIRRYQAESLEDVFLKLSVMQNLGKRRRSSILADVVERVELPAIPNPAAIDLEEAELGEISGEFGDNVSMSSKGRVVVTPDINPPVDSLPPEEKPKGGCMESFMPMKWHHMKALIWKNFLSLFRNFGVLAFIVGLPVSQMLFFCLAIGHYPEGLPIAVVNYESNSTTALCPYDKNACPQNPETWEWNLTMFSCRYLDYLSKRQNNLIYYPDKASAIEDAQHGKTRLVLVFPANYSSCLQDRITDPRNANYYTVKNSDMEAHMDDTDKQVEWMLQRDLGLAFAEATEQLADICHLPPRIMSIPVHFNKPIYGLTVPNFTDFAGPGVILTIIFFLAVALTSGAMLAERNEGILERSLVSGITGTEILFSHVTVQMLVMCVQTVMVLLIGFILFGLTMKGPLGWVVTLTLATGLCGMTFGFVVSCICDTDRTATYMALGSFLPMVLLCGIIWPVEGMHIILQWISYVLPLTKSTESLRSMLQRGWSISVPTVYSGFISTAIWIAIYLTTSILLLKFKKG